MNKARHIIGRLERLKVVHPTHQRKLEETAGVLGSLARAPGGSITSVGATSRTIGSILSDPTNKGSKNQQEVKLLGRYLLVVMLKLQELLKKL
jgi:hypothetical protein